MQSTRNMFKLKELNAPQHNATIRRVVYRLQFWNMQPNYYPVLPLLLLIVEISAERYELKCCQMLGEWINQCMKDIKFIQVLSPLSCSQNLLVTIKLLLQTTFDVQSRWTLDETNYAAINLAILLAPNLYSTALFPNTIHPNKRFYLQRCCVCC